MQNCISKEFLCKRSKLSISTPEFAPDRNYLFGKVTDRSVILGLRHYFFKSTRIRLLAKKNRLYVNKGTFVYPAIFSIKNNNPLLKGTVKWELVILNSGLTPVHKFSGEGNLPRKIFWHEISSIPTIIPGRSYFFFLKAYNYKMRFTVITKPTPFAIIPASRYRYRFSSKLLLNYKRSFNTRSGRKILSKVSKRMSGYPERKWFMTAYVTAKEAVICKNIQLLKQELSHRSDISMEKINATCVMLDKPVVEGKHITIIGAKIKKKVRLYALSNRDDHVLRINKKVIPLNNDHLFFYDSRKILKDSDNRGYLSLKLTAKTGEVLEMKFHPSHHYVKLNPGTNRIRNLRINLKKDARDIYCGTIVTKALSVMLGAGPYMISDTIASTGDLHLLAYYLSIEKPFSFIKSELDLSAVPTSIAGSADSPQTFYHMYLSGGYKFDFSFGSVTPFLCYFLYLSGNNTYKDRELIKFMGAPFVGASIKSKNVLFERLNLKYSLKFSPRFSGTSTMYSTDNTFTFEYRLWRRASAVAGYRKHFFVYKYKTHEEKYIENVDMLIFAYKYHF